jgi:anaerobic ribonucleoside-triphosphate reductase activating protein
MLLGGINALSTNDTDGLCASVFFQGCNIHCPGCHNPELQPFDPTKLTNTDQVMATIEKNRDWYDAVAFMGGEPLCQPSALLDLLRRVKKLGLDTWLYTGREFRTLPIEVIEGCDVIVAGPYIEDLATGGFPASRNQVFVDRRKGEQQCN